MHDHQRFAEEFASVVTAASDNEQDMVARNGNESIYALLIRCVPEVRTLVTRHTHTESRSLTEVKMSTPLMPFRKQMGCIDGKLQRRGSLTCTVFNKALEMKCGFNRFRTRRRIFIR